MRITTNGWRDIWAVVAARIGSERLPGKVLLPLGGKPALTHLVRRLRRCRYLTGVTVATTMEKEDDAIGDWGAEEGVPVFRGSRDDVLSRTLDAARAVGADLIVQVTGDCPLVDPRVCDRVVERFLRERPDYASTSATYPRGVDTEVFATKLLEEVAGRTEDPRDREHVTLYIYSHPERYRVLLVDAPNSQTRPDLRLTLDTPEDMRVIEAVHAALAPADPYFGLDDMIAFLDTNPGIARLNAHVRQRQP